MMALGALIGLPVVIWGWINPDPAERQLRENLLKERQYLLALQEELKILPRGYRRLHVEKEIERIKFPWGRDEKVGIARKIS